MFQRLNRGGWPYSQPPNVPFEINEDSEQADGLVMWMPWGGGTPGAHRHVDRIGGLVFTEGGTPVWVSDGQRGWSMLFDDAQNEYLQAASAPATAAPLTMACWFYCDDAAADQVLMDLGADATNYFLIFANTSGGAASWLRAYIEDAGGESFATTTAAWSINAWHHACGVFATSTSRAVYLDGGNKGTDAGDHTPAGVDTTDIGQYIAGTLRFSGRIADVRIYNRALTDAQIYQMYANPWELWCPLRQWVVGYAPVIRIPRPPAAYNTLAIY